MSTSCKRPGSPQVNEVPTKRPAKLVEVVSDGDVLLVVGQGVDALKIRVSGIVISLASEVFSRMLSSPFTEGRSKEIELREDDPEAVLDFCNIVHHKAENVNHRDGSRLVKLVEFADARFCVKALRPWVSARLAGIMEQFEDYERNKTPINHNRISPEDDPLELTMEQCMSVAAVFKMNHLFWFATKHFLLLQGPCSTLPALPSFVESALESGVHDLHEGIAKASKLQSREFFDDIFECVGRDLDVNEVLQTGSCFFVKYGSMMVLLARKGFKPGRPGQYKKSTSSAMLEIRSISHSIGDWTTLVEITECEYGNAECCPFCQRDIAADLVEVVAENMQRARGACLICYDNGCKDYFHATHRHGRHGTCPSGWIRRELL
ncbi:hypothetical protein AYO20_09040 [Fonsecaea nubica]|uniref:BTB domain-containing protein n=1 Tax=Fonsecaea nubica TaxID=856822 RepID=A0A178CIF6_9EURO|nr:hypothetical protein AYO20_09040 [Fonsecaea nubica]OAL29748.1 hypothetical protein AYO20_09040 [Fonsecaea nubica]